MPPALLTHVFDAGRHGRDGPVSLAIHIADTLWSRFRGLHAFPDAGVGRALLLWPCRAVHTAGMPRPIDVVFVDRRFRALRVVSGLRPSRAAFCLRAYGVLELPAGYCQTHPGFSASLPDLGARLLAARWPKAWPETAPLTQRTRDARRTR